MYKHYIRLKENIDGNGNKEIEKYFSDAFETPIQDDILIVETRERHAKFGDNYDRHSWDDAIVEYVLTAAEIKNINTQKRLIAYRGRSDKLFLEWQYEKEKGRLTAEQIDALKNLWLNEVDTIKQEITL